MIALWTTGEDLNTYKGSFAKLQDEGVWRDVRCWIRVGWMRLDLESGLRVLYSKT